MHEQEKLTGAIYARNMIDQIQYNVFRPDLEGDSRVAVLHFDACMRCLGFRDVDGDTRQARA